MNELKIFLILIIISFILLSIKIYISNRKKIKKEDLDYFIYYSTISILNDLNYKYLVNDFDYFKICVKALICNKVIEEIELDSEYKNIINNYELYSEISKIIDEDEDINKKLKERYNDLYVDKDDESEEESYEYIKAKTKDKIDFFKYLSTYGEEREEY